MPIVSTSGTLSTVTNTFWVAANVIYEIKTGEKKEVLMLVNDVKDATVFADPNEANRYAHFVATRSPEITWSVERLTAGHSLQRLGKLVIKGVQYVR